MLLHSEMQPIIRKINLAMKINLRGIAFLPVIFLFAASVAFAESCATSSEMDPGMKTALQNAAVQYFGFVASGNTAQVAANSITDIANNNEGLNGLLTEHKDKL